jgi:hypothetical protein
LYLHAFCPQPRGDGSIRPRIRHAIVSRLSDRRVSLALAVAALDRWRQYPSDMLGAWSSAQSVSALWLARRLLTCGCPGSCRHVTLTFLWRCRSLHLGGGSVWSLEIYDSDHSRSLLVRLCWRFLEQSVSSEWHLSRELLWAGPVESWKQCTGGPGSTPGGMRCADEKLRVKARVDGRVKPARPDNRRSQLRAVFAKSPEQIYINPASLSAYDSPAHPLTTAHPLGSVPLAHRSET